MVLLVDQVAVVDQVMHKQIQEEQEIHLLFHLHKEKMVVLIYIQLHLTHKVVVAVVLL